MKINKITEKYIVDMLKLKMQKKDKEMVYMVLVNKEGLPFSFKCIKKGEDKSCNFDMAELEMQIMLHEPKAIYISHNHPGNIMIATSFDDDFTRKTVKLCKIKKVELVDHIIIMGTRDEYFSYRERTKFASDFEKTKSNVSLKTHKTTKK